MGVLIVTAVFPPEPVVSAKLSFDLASAISETEDVLVLSPKPTRPLGFDFGKTKETLKFKHTIADSFTCPKSSLFGRLRETYSFGKHTYRFIEDNYENIRLIYANTWPLLAQYYTVKAAKKYSIPVILHVQDIYPESLANKLPFGKSLFNSILMPFDRFVFQHADKVIAISEKMRDYFVKTRKINTDRILVVENWQDEEEFVNYRDDLVPGRDKDATFTFLYLGNIGPVAGCDLLIDAFAHANLKNCRLVIAGSGSGKEELQKKCANIKNVNIEFWPVPNGEVQRIQALSHVMLLPMKKGAASSSVPSKLSAYMLSKKPIIACVDDKSATSIAVTEAKCGWVIPSGNIQLLARVMEQAASTPENDLKIKGNNGFDYAMNHYSKKNNLNKILKIIGI